MNQSGSSIYSVYSIRLGSINIGRGSQYLPLPKWIILKKAVINPQNNDNKCFQYAVTIALNWKEIGKNPQRIKNVLPFIEKYNWSGTDFLVELFNKSKGIKEFEKQIKTLQ